MSDDANTDDIPVEDATPDASAYEAKIAELESAHATTIAESSATIEGLTSELTAAKAHNYDLLVAGNKPADEVLDTPANFDNDEDGDIDIDDLFTK